MIKTINLKKGLNMRLAGQLSDTSVAADIRPARIAISPDDYPGFLPKPEVKEGDTVSQGAPLMHDKNDPDVKLVSPISGTVESIVRGARRKIERIVVIPSDECQAASAIDTASVKTEADVRRALKKSGLWAMMRRRPYDIVPTDGDRPRDIFVTAMDTAPLALDPCHTIAGKEAEIAKGVETLKRLTDGTVYISIAQGCNFPDIKGAEIVKFNRLHPAGNPGVQIANIAPLSKGETVWTLDIATLANIGHLMLTGKVDFTVTVAITGSEVENPRAVTTVPGALSPN